MTGRYNGRILKKNEIFENLHGSWKMYEQRRMGAYGKESYKQRSISPDEIFQGILKLILKENDIGKGKWEKIPKPRKILCMFQKEISC